MLVEWVNNNKTKIDREYLKYIGDIEEKEFER